MKVAIIGAGKMGRWFTKFFLDEGDSVIVSDKDEGKLSKIKDELGVETASNVSAVKKAGGVLICVPIDDFEDVLREVQPHLRADHVVMDICSIKEIPVKIMHDYVKTGIALGTHPVFGPGAKSIKSKNFVLTPITEEEKKIAEDFRVWLEERQANVFIMPPRRHDELMSVVLGLPHFLGLVVCDTLLDYADFPETKRVAGSTYKMLLTLAEAVASEESGFYTSLQMTLPEIEKIEGLFFEKSREWLNLIKCKDKTAFANRMELVKSKLTKVNPDYTKSYEIMHKLLETVKS